MGLHKITAGTGYDYLTRQVAAQDSTEKGHTGLASYYSERGETPGVWLGSGMAGIDGLDAGDVVTAEQMQALFGSGHHPLAGPRGVALPLDASIAQIHDATRLGQPFKVYAHDIPEFRIAVADACAAYNRNRGVPEGRSVPSDVRAAIRTRIGRDMFRAATGRDPLDARELSGHIAKLSRPQTTSVAGFDLTFSPVKSVSTLWALAEPDVAAKIEIAHRAAISDALRFVETHALFSRTGTNGVRQVNVHGLVATAFTHRDTRAGDPDLHTHVAVANKVQTLDGRWMSIDGRLLYKAIVTTSEVYNTSLERHLADALGVRFAERPSTEPGKRPVREIVGVNPELNRRWSARRLSIEHRQGQLAAAFQADHGRPPTIIEARVLAQQATLETRAGKHAPRRLADQRAAWRAEAETVLGAGGIEQMLHTALAPARRMRPDTVSARWVQQQSQAIVTTMEGSRARWQEWHVRAEALRIVRAAQVPTRRVEETVARLTHTALQRGSVALEAPADHIEEPAALRRVDDESVYRVARSTWHTSRRVLAAEHRLIEAAARTGGFAAGTVAVDTALLEAAANGAPLNAGQVALVRQMATSGARLQLAIAPAGSGKTTAMRALSDAWRNGGGTVIGLAPSAAAAAQLGTQIDTHTDTMAMLTHALTHGRPLPGWAEQVGPTSLLIIDEAGMADTLSLDQIVTFALDRGASVRLIGDDQQLAAIGAGGVLRDIATRHGALHLNELVRFADPAEGAASLALRDGDTAALGFYLDQRRVHVGDQTGCVEAVFAAWTDDRNGGLDALMLAPTRTLVADLNARAQAHLHPAADGPSIALADGNTARIGDVVITRSNDRGLRVTAGDWVKNGDRWTITEINPDGSLQVRHNTHQGVVHLPAGYVSDAVELGYACTIHGAQGVTADTMHGLLSGTETRQQLYTMLTRGRRANHVHLEVVGDGDTHTLIRPEALIPPTATDLLQAILARDDAPTSATSTAAELAHPATRLAAAVARYSDAIGFAAEQTAGPELLHQLDVTAEDLWPGLTDAPAWPTLRAHLVLSAANGNDPLAQLTRAVTARDLTDAVDPAAVLDWRIDTDGPYRTDGRPLPWLPAIPSTLTQHAQWGPYLQARRDLVADLAAQVTLHAHNATTHPAWAPQGSQRPDPATIADITVWRAAHAVPDSDTRATGERRQAAAEARWQRQLDRRLVDALAPAVAEWTPLLCQVAPACDGDPFAPILAHRLAQIASVGLDAHRLLGTATGEGALPDDHAAAALWWRICRHLTPAVANTLADEHQALLTNWLPTLHDVAGPDRATALEASPWWPALVTTFDTALARGWRLADLIGAPPADTDIDDCQALVWRTSMLLQPLPEPDPEPEPHDSVEPSVRPVVRDANWEQREAPLDPEDVPLDPAEPSVRPVVRDVDWEQREAPLDPEDVPLDPQDMPSNTAWETLPSSQASDVDQPGRSDSDGVLDAPDTIGDLTATLEAELRRGQRPPELPQADLYAQMDRADAWKASHHTPARFVHVNSMALEFYQARYPGSWAQPYLAGRFAGDITHDPDIRPGFAPAGWTPLVDHLRRRGVTDAELLATGLAGTASTGRLIDRFRDRAVFPIVRDGQVLGFVGRRHPDKDDFDQAGPKYYNTPETLLFHKRAQLFVAGQRHLDAGAIPVLVEGPADAIAVTRASGGRYVGVAPLGTNLTAEQAIQLRRFGRDPVIATDNDVAGQTAAQRDYWILTPHQLQPRHAALPDGADPAQLVAEGHSARLVDALDQAGTLADALIAERFANLPAPAAALASGPVLAAQPVDAWEHTVHLIAEHLKTDTALVRDTIALHGIRAWTDDPQRVAQTQLDQINQVRERLAAADTGRRWAASVSRIDPQLTTDPASWHTLARTLQDAHEHGLDVDATLAFATGDPLDPQRPVDDLAARIRVITTPEPILRPAKTVGPRHDPPTPSNGPAPQRPPRR